MYRVGVLVWGDVVDWFCVHESVQDCLTTIAYNQRLDYDAGEVCEYTYEEIFDDRI